MEDSLYGEIISVTYYSEDTHFGVVRIKLDYQDKKIAKYRAKLFTNLLTVTCNFDRKPVKGEEIDFTGEFVTNQYGVQFKASGFTRRNEKTPEGVVAYLSSDLFPGVGKVTAQRIYETLGNDCLSVIESDAKALDRVRGLSEKQKDVISVNLLSYAQDKKILVGLLDFGITMNTALKLYKILGANSCDIIRENPYRLIELIEGFGFRRADKIALDMGISETSEVRLKAMFMYLLHQVLYSTGDTYLEHDDFFEKLKNETNQNSEILDLTLFDEILKKLQIERRIYADSEKNIYDFRIYNAEVLLAEKVKQFMNREIVNGYNKEDILGAIKKSEQECLISYNEKQKEAIIGALTEPLIIITGGPGTGKSTIIRAIIDCFSRLGNNEIIREKIALCAPTGRAAKRLREVTGHPSQTIHKLLGYEGHGSYKNGPEAKIDCKVLIVDEFSMVDTMLAARLFATLEDDTRIIIVGDSDQLPSVEPGDVLTDLISTKEIRTVRLDKIHRQADDSTIISLAHAINQGDIPENILEKQHDRNFLKMQDVNIIPNIIKTIDQAMTSGMSLIKDIQVLVPMYKGEIGIHAMNYALQEKFNPANGRELKHMNRVFRVNDKVIQLVNRSEKKVMNGDIGYVFSLDYRDGEYQGLTVIYDFGSVDYTKDELEDLAHAYAISIHKSQGSEFDLAIIPFSFRYYIMLKRKLIYTAITRAKKYLIMMGSIEAFSRGIGGIEEKRKTKLSERIKTKMNTIFDFENLGDDMENISPYDFLD